jgi:hypothetical protein
MILQSEDEEVEEDEEGKEAGFNGRGGYLQYINQSI